MRKSTKSNKMTKLRKTQRGGGFKIPILDDIYMKYNEYSTFKLPEDKENNRLSMFAKMKNMKELASELYLKKGEILEAMKKSKNTPIITQLIKRFGSNRHNENWFLKNFITSEQVEDYYTHHQLILSKNAAELENEETEFKSKLNAKEKKNEEHLKKLREQYNKMTFKDLEDEYKSEINEMREHQKRLYKQNKLEYQNQFKKHVCDTIATYLKQLYIIITGSKNGVPERPTIDRYQYYSCDDISKFPSIKSTSEENRTLLSSILGQDAMEKFIQNYNDVKDANEKNERELQISELLERGDVIVDTGDVIVDTGDVIVDTDDVIVDTDDVIVDTDNVIVDTDDAREPERMGAKEGGSRKKRRRRRNKSNKK